MSLKPYKFIIILICVVFFVSAENLSAAEKWSEYKANHFIIYYKNAPQDFIKSIEQTAESYYDEIADNLGFMRFKGWTWNERALIYIYDNAQDYVDSAKQSNWSHGVASPKDKIIRTFPAAHGFFDSILPHELGHIIFREFVGFKSNIPLWFDEGVAMYQEKAKRWGAHEAVREAIQTKKFIPLSELNMVHYLTNNSPRELIDLFYAESASVIYYMIQELGQQRFVNFCKKLKDGTPFEWALHSVYVRFRNLDDLNKAWVSYLTNTKK